MNYVNPRRLALRVLSRWGRGDALLDEILEAERQRHPLSPEDAALLHELVLGTVRWQRRLDAVLDRLARKGLASLPRPLLPVLRMAVYQMMFLSRVPRHAIVDEAVKETKRGHAPGLAGLVNAMLRAAPEEPGSLPLATTSTIERLGVAHSFPDFLVAQWLEELGEAETEELLASLNQRPGLWLRVNRERISVDDLRRHLSERGVETQPEPLHPAALRLPAGTRVFELPGYAEGWFVIQDPAAMLVGELCAAPAGGVVLDACAAPGGKTLQLAEQTGPQGRVFALEPAYARLARLRENVARAGDARVVIIEADARRMPPSVPEVVDLALVDAPCSGLGTLRRRVDLRWRLSPEDIPRLAALAGEILDSVAEKVRPGGALVYATCTLTHEENEDVVQRFLSRHRAFTRRTVRPYLPAAAQGFVNATGDLVVWPHRSGTDGAYAARLERTQG